MHSQIGTRLGLFTVAILQISIATLALCDALLLENRLGMTNWHVYNTSMMSVPTSVCLILNGVCLILVAKNERLWHGKPC